MQINKKTTVKITVEFDEMEAIHINNWLVTHTAGYRGDTDETKALVEFSEKLSSILVD